MRYKLGNICKMRSGGTPRRGDSTLYNGDIPWVTISDFKNATNNYIYQTKNSLTSEGLNAINNRVFEKDTLLLAMYGSIGKTVIAGKKLTCNQAILGINPKDKTQLNIKFLKYWFDHNKRFIQSKGRGATLKNISLTIVKNLEIDLPDLEIQDKIVAVLDNANVVIEKREKAIIKLEELLNATFLKMFGLKNPSYEFWDDVEIESLKKTEKGSMRTGPFGSKLKHNRFKEKGEVAVLGIDNAVDNQFKWKKKRFLPIDEYDEFKKFTVKSRDVIITIMGTVGRSAVIPENIGLAINTKHLAALTLDETKCNPYYLSYSIHSNPYVTFQLNKKSRGAIMDGLNLTSIKSVKLKKAPIELQNKFEKIYLKIQKQKDKMLLAKKKSKILLQALSQLAFKEELKFNTAVDLEVLMENDYEFFRKNSSKNSIKLLLEKLDKEKLNSNIFYEQELYDKAKEFVFELLNERKIKQVYDEDSKRIKLSI